MWSGKGAVSASSFNRTFMELKLVLSAALLLLASFNRTFMELKYQYSIINAKNITVLIVPLWN